MKLYVTALSKSLTPYSYMIDAFFQKLFSRTLISCTNHCGETTDHDYRNHCESNSPKSTRTGHCGQRSGGDYRGHC